MSGTTLVCIHADFDVEFNSLSEDHQDFAPEDETHNTSKIHSFVSSEDMSIQILIEEVLKLLRADKFPNKTDEVFGGNRLRSSIVMEC